MRKMIRIAQEKFEEENMVFYNYDEISDVQSKISDSSNKDMEMKKLQQKQNKRNQERLEFVKSYKEILEEVAFKFYYLHWQRNRKLITMSIKQKFLSEVSNNYYAQDTKFNNDFVQQSVQQTDFKLLPQSFDIARHYLSQLFDEMQDNGLQNLTEFFNQQRPESLKNLKFNNFLELEKFISILKEYFNSLIQVGSVLQRPKKINRIQNRKIAPFGYVSPQKLKKQGIAFTDFNEISQQDLNSEIEFNSLFPGQVPLSVPKNNFDTVFLYVGDIYDSKILNETESIENHIQIYDSKCRFQIYKPKRKHYGVIKEEEKESSSSSSGEEEEEKEDEQLKNQNNSSNGQEQRSDRNSNQQQQNHSNRHHQHHHGRHNFNRSHGGYQNTTNQLLETQSHLATFLQEMCLEAIEIVESRIFQSYYFYVIHMNFQTLINRLRLNYIYELKQQSQKKMFFQQKRNNNSIDLVSKKLQILRLVQNYVKQINQIVDQEFLKDKTSEDTQIFYQNIINSADQILNQHQKKFQKGKSNSSNNFFTKPKNNIIINNNKIIDINHGDGFDNSNKKKSFLDFDSENQSDMESLSNINVELQQLFNLELEKRMIAINISIIKEIDMIKSVKKCFDELTNQFFYGEQYIEYFELLKKQQKKQQQQQMQKEVYNPESCTDLENKKNIENSFT